MRGGFVFLFLILAVNIVSGQTKAVSVFNGKGRIQLPVNFTPMSSAEVKSRYPTAKRQPSEAFQNTGTMVVFAFYPTKDKSTTDEIIALKESYFEGYRNAKGFKWENGEVRSFNGRKYLVLSMFSGEHAGFNVFNYQIIGEIEGEVVMVSVTCPVQVLKKERPLIDQTLKSFSIRKK